PEDEKLAKALKNVDFIVAGHTHKTYGHYVNNVPISQVGSFGKNLGVIDLKFNVKTKKLSPLTQPQKWSHAVYAEGVKDPTYLNIIKNYKNLIQERFSKDLPPIDKI